MSSEKVGIEIGALAGLDLHRLRERWCELYACDAPKHMSPELLRRALAYRIQEKAHGGLPSAIRVRLLARPVSPLSGGGRSRIDRSTKPGTRFIREWNGRTHEVTATPDGRFTYAGETYRSLSAIAREITGTHWSGPTFFGLNEAGKKGAGR
jgi:hypothetical protein